MTGKSRTVTELHRQNRWRKLQSVIVPYTSNKNESALQLSPQNSIYHLLLLKKLRIVPTVGGYDKFDITFAMLQLR